MLIHELAFLQPALPPDVAISAADAVAAKRLRRVRGWRREANPSPVQPLPSNGVKAASFWLPDEGSRSSKKSYV